MTRFRRSAPLFLVTASVAFAAVGCDPGAENDAAFMKEAGAGQPIPDFDKGYADRKERRRAELDAKEKEKPAPKSGPRGRR